MNRKTLLCAGAAAGAGLLCAANPAQAGAASAETPLRPIKPPATAVPVAFLVSEGTVMIDFAGPWEVFQDADVAGRTAQPFATYVVAESMAPISTSGGAKLIPNYDFSTAPPPKVVVVPAQAPPTPAVLHWLTGVARTADVVMSVCTGAFVLAKAGLLDGHNATTHHSSLARLTMEYPKVTVRRGARFTDDGKIATSAGLSAGIDLAMHVVARYYGKQAAHETAYDMEYLSSAWLNEHSNVAYRTPPAARPGFALCALCWMQVDPKNSPSTTYHGKRYYFCTPDHEQLFASNPQRFLNVS